MLDLGAVRVHCQSLLYLQRACHEVAGSLEVADRHLYIAQLGQRRREVALGLDGVRMRLRQFLRKREGFSGLRVRLRSVTEREEETDGLIEPSATQPRAGRRGL